MASSDPRVPLFNLSVLGQKMDSLRRFLSDSVDRNAAIGGDQIQMVSTEITSAVHQIIMNGAALLASSQPQNLGSTAAMGPVVYGEPSYGRDPTSSSVKASRSVDLSSQIAGKLADQGVSAFRFGDQRDLSAPVFRKTPDLSADLKDPNPMVEDDADCDIVEIDAVELLAEHIHFCEICGKGFKRDANLRMHMRAHGNRFKTLEALSKPDHRFDVGPIIERKIRFSCPFAGCNRNRAHKRFRPLKSAVCVKNHFKRSHCPKMYSCNRCNKKSFSVLADLKSHLKHCGECRWRCSCGTSFSRKDKLFGHMTLFEGHMPAVVVEEEEGKGVALEEEEEEEMKVEAAGEAFYPEFFDGLDGFGMMDEAMFGL